MELSAISVPARVCEAPLEKPFRGVTLKALSILLLPSLVLCIIPLFSRFWLDETIAYWTTNGGWSELVPRSIGVPQSIPFTALFLLLREIGGKHEWVYRIPSLAAALASAVLLFRFTREYYSEFAAWSAVILYSCQSTVVFAASDARPYGLTLATTVLSTMLLMRWAQSGTVRAAVLYSAVAALNAHLHMLFVTIPLFQMAFIVLRRKHWRLRWRDITVVTALLGVFLAPLIPQYVYSTRLGATHSFASKPSLFSLLVSLVPMFVMLAAAAAAMAALVMRLRPRLVTPAGSPAMLVLPLCWAVVPPVMMFAISHLTDSRVFVARYILPYTGGLSLCLAIVLDRVRPRAVQVMVLVLSTALATGYMAHERIYRHTATHGDWGAAIELVNTEWKARQIPAFIRSNLIFSDHRAWQSEVMDDSVLYNPLTFYRSPAKWHPLPCSFSPEARAFLDQEVARLEAAHRGFFFLTIEGPTPEAPFLDYFQSVWGGKLRTALRGTYDGVKVWEFAWR
jgi:4-amino-4-deoxy-L-arabinose transferase-like glycosyltransferase